VTATPWPPSSPGRRPVEDTRRGGANAARTRSPRPGTNSPTSDGGRAVTSAWTRARLPWCRQFPGRTQRSRSRGARLTARSCRATVNVSTTRAVARRPKRGCATLISTQPATFDSPRGPVPPHTHQPPQPGDERSPRSSSTLGRDHRHAARVSVFSEARPTVTDWPPEAPPLSAHPLSRSVTHPAARGYGSGVPKPTGPEANRATRGSEAPVRGRRLTATRGARRRRWSAPRRRTAASSRGLGRRSPDG
jgi:hypothetical protein